MLLHCALTARLATHLARAHAASLAAAHAASLTFGLGINRCTQCEEGCENSCCGFGCVHVVVPLRE
jgi:hypothetical protein